MCSSRPSPRTFDHLQEDEIRVLYLDPGTLEEPLTGELKLASITPDTSGRWLPRPHSSVQYEAISYAWGSLEKPHSIKIRNIGEIPITASLFDILRRFRSVHRHRELWVDGICIDQADVSERNHQVAKMADIFSASKRVLVWFGAGESTDSLAFAAMEVYRDLGGPDGDNDNIHLEMLGDALCEYTGTYAPLRWNLELEETVVVKALKSIFNIFQATWFERLWVVQETDAFRDVLFFRGYHGISNQKDLLEGLRFLEDYAREIRSHDIRIDRRALNEIWEHMAGYCPPPKDGGEMISHILQYSDRRCHDPRDRVYALRRRLGLERFDELRPDYQLDYVEVFRRLICVCLNLEQTWPNMTTSLIHPALALALVGTELKPRSNPDSPSWVSCLHELTGATKAKERLYGRGCLMHEYLGAGSLDDAWLAHGKLLKARVLPESLNLLHLRGRCFAKAHNPGSLQDVPDVGPRYSYDDTTTRDHVEAVANWFAAYCSFVVDYILDFLDMGLEKNLLDFALYSAKWNYPYRLDRKHFGNDFIELLKLLVARGAGGRLNLGPDLDHKVLDLALQLPECALALRRKLWQVQLEGRTDAAWLSAETQIGDSICVVPGTPWPFVIRKWDDTSYILIGDAHVFGTSLMEALGSGRQQYKFCHGRPLGFNTDIQPSDEDMTNLSWITIC
jgi:hypothetical protein